MLKILIKMLFKTLFKIKTADLEKINEYLTYSKKNIFICNHLSFLDGLILGLFLPGNPVFLIHSSVLKNKLFKYVLSHVDYLAIDTNNPMALKTLTNEINNGRNVVIFPEGRITTTGSLMKVYDGTAFVAAKTEANIIPITLQGLLKSKLSRMKNDYPKVLFPAVTIKAHEPYKIEVDKTLMARQRRKQAGEKLRKILQENHFDSINTNKTIYSAFLESMEYFGKQHIVLEDLDYIEINYDKFHLMLRGVGHLITKETKSHYIGLLLPNTPIGAAAFFGVSAFDRVPCMLNYTMSKDSFLSCLKIAGISTVVTAKQFIEKGKLQHLVKVCEDNNIQILYLENMKEKVSIFDKFKIKLNLLGLNKSDDNYTKDATVLFTSGSEGTPKGVVLSHKALLSNVAQVRSVIDISTEDKICNVLPIFHSFGLTAGTILPILSGSKLLLYVSPLHYRIVPELVYDRNCTVLFGTNTFLFNYAKNANNYDFYKIRYVVAGAEKVSDMTRNVWFEKFGIRILEGYGATECAPVISVNTPMANKFGSVGQLLPKIKYRLEEIPGVEGGKLWISGPNLLSGYFKENNPGILEKNNGWYDTGDIVQISEDGFVTIKGRVKRFVKIAGEMVSLEVVDKIVGSVTDKLFATTSKPDANKGERIIVFTLDETLTKDKIRNKITEMNQSNLMMPSEIYLTDSIPLLGSGKIDYQTLKKMAIEK